MSLDTYANLKASIASWLNREDLTSQITDFIALAEARFNREIRTPDMSKRTTASVTSGYVTLPTDWLQAITIRLPGVNGYPAMEYLSPELFYDLQGQSPTGPTRYYTIIGNQLRLIPEPTEATSIEMTYYGKIPVLSDSNTSNWLLARSPDVYLYGSLVAAEAFLMNDERLGVWKGATDEIIAGIRLEGEKAARPSGALQVRKRTFG